MPVVPGLPSAPGFIKCPPGFVEALLDQNLELDKVSGDHVPIAKPETNSPAKPRYPANKILIDLAGSGLWVED